MSTETLAAPGMTLLASRPHSNKSVHIASRPYSINLTCLISTEKLADPGMTLLAPGHTETDPTVQTRLGSSALYRGRLCCCDAELDD